MPPDLYYVSQTFPVDWYFGEVLAEHGRVIELQGGRNEDRLIDLRYIRPVPANARLATCGVCGARFLSETWCVKHGYAHHDPAELALHLSQMTSTPEPALAPRSRVGHPEDAEWRSWTLEYLLEMMKSGWQKAREECPNKKRPSFQNVADEIGYSRKSLSDGMKRHGYTWDKIRPLLHD